MAYPQSGEIASSTVGAMSELRVCVDLMARQYHVFRAMSPASPCDLVAFKSGETPLRIEVRTGFEVRSTGVLSFARPDEARYDVLAVVLADRIVYVPALDAEEAAEGF